MSDPRLPLLTSLRSSGPGRRAGSFTSTLLTAFLATSAVAAGRLSPIPVTGVVLEASGAPVAGALVELHPESRGLEENLRLLKAGGSPRPTAAVRTDEAGSFRLEAPAPGLWRLAVRLPGRATVWSVLHPALAPVDRTISLPPPVRPRSATGRAGPSPQASLLVRRNGHPVAGALLLAGPLRRPVAATGADGRITCPAPELSGLLQTSDGAFYALLPDDAELGGMRLIDLPVPRTVEGTVVDARSGRPIPDALVWPEGEPWNLTRARADGGFVVTAFGPTSAPALRVAGTGYAATAAHLPDASDAELTVPLEPLTLLTGVVADLRGRPVPGARAEAFLEAAGGQAPPAALTDAEGRFELALPVPGPVVVEVRRRGFVPARSGRVLVETGERRRLEKLTLRRLVRLRGTVLEVGGGPVTGARVEARQRGDNQPLAYGESDLSGAFVLENLAEGSEVDLHTALSGYADDLLESVEVGSRPVEIVLAVAASVSGRIAAPDGRPVSGGQVTARVQPRADGAAAVVRLGESRSFHAIADADGVFVLNGLCPGQLTLRGEAPGYQAVERVGLPLDAGAYLEGVVLVLDPAALLEGRVLGPDGEPADGAEVTVVYDVRSGTIHSLVADGRGRFSLGGLAPGTVSVIADRDNLRSAGARLDLALGRNQVELVLGPGIPVHGRVTDGTAPIAGATVSVEGSGLFPERSAATTDTDGYFLVRGLAPGSYRLEAHREGFVPGEHTVDVAGEPAPFVEITLAAGGTVHGRLLGLAAGELDAAEVAATGPRGTVRSGRTEPMGGYRIDGLGPGRWVVIGAADGGARQARLEIEMGPGGDEQVADLDFRTGLTLSGTVGIAGCALAGARVEVVSSDGTGAAFDVTDGAGSFRISGLAEGVYGLTVNDPERSLVHREGLDLETDTWVPIDLEAAPIGGEVRRAGGAPVPGAVVSLLSEDTPAERPLSLLTDPEGRFVFSLVQAGDYVLRIELDGQTVARQEIAHTGYGPGAELQVVVQDPSPITR